MPPMMFGTALFMNAPASDIGSLACCTAPVFEAPRLARLMTSSVMLTTSPMRFAA